MELNKFDFFGNISLRRHYQILIQFGFFLSDLKFCYHSIILLFKKQSVAVYWNQCITILLSKNDLLCSNYLRLLVAIGKG